jgi:hypothetical protein
VDVFRGQPTDSAGGHPDIGNPGLLAVLELDERLWSLGGFAPMERIAESAFSVDSVAAAVSRHMPEIKDGSIVSKCVPAISGKERPLIEGLIQIRTARGYFDRGEAQIPGLQGTQKRDADARKPSDEDRHQGHQQSEFNHRAAPPVHAWIHIWR